MNIYITRFPFLFWNMKFEKDIDIDFEKNILKKNEEKIYNFEKLNKTTFLFFKYLPIFVFLILVFNKFDFTPSIEKISEYAVGLFLAFLLFYAKRYLFFTAFAISIIVGGFISFSGVAFLVKYLLTFICVFSFANDITTEPYNIIKNQKTIASFILEEEK